MGADIELRHLRAFVAVAEELNFTRAAARLFVVQQALSAQIRQLEERLGVTLLHRTTRRVSLTPAGEELYDRARRLLDEADDLVVAIREVDGGRRVITVGFVAPQDQDEVADALECAQRALADLRVVVRFGDLLDPTGGLRNRQSDVAFTYGPFDTTGLSLEPIFEQPLGVAVAVDHPFAARTQLHIADVVDEPTFDFPTPDARWKAFWDLHEHRRTPPRYVGQFHSLDALVRAIGSGAGVHVATRPLVESVGVASGITWRPVLDLPPLQHHITWRADDDRASVSAFVDEIRRGFGALD